MKGKLDVFVEAFGQHFLQGKEGIYVHPRTLLPPPSPRK
jgi:hypothetical protein